MEGGYLVIPVCPCKSWMLPRLGLKCIHLVRLQSCALHSPDMFILLTCDYVMTLSIQSRSSVNGSMLGYHEHVVSEEFDEIRLRELSHAVEVP